MQFVWRAFTIVFLYLYCVNFNAFFINKIYIMGVENLLIIKNFGDEKKSDSLNHVSSIA